MSSTIAVATNSRFMMGCQPIPADLKAHRRAEKQRYLDIKQRYEEQSRRSSLASPDESRRNSAFSPDQSRRPSEASSTKSKSRMDKIADKLVKGSALKAQLKFYS